MGDGDTEDSTEESARGGAGQGQQEVSSKLKSRIRAERRGKSNIGGEFYFSLHAFISIIKLYNLQRT